MNCEKCRWYIVEYTTARWGEWKVHGRFLLGGCDGSQFEPNDEQTDEVEK